MRFSLKYVMKFERYFVKAGGDNCWIWNGGVFSKDKPYAKFYHRGKLVKASRYAYRLYKGRIPKGLDVLHKCDNPLCVNPNHLFLGTQLDNMRDMIRKGRKRVVVGEAHPNAKLTDEDVAEIRRMYKRTGPFQSNVGEVAKRFNIHVETARLIAIGKKRSQGSGKVAPGKKAVST